MKLYVTVFSPEGEKLADKIAGLTLEICYGQPFSAGRFVAPRLECYLRHGEKLGEWVRQAFAEHAPILFIGAMGIAVRAMAPFVSDKAVDSPVLVADEAGRYVIPVLSGHLGGANELAEQLAGGIGADAVLTTATDVHHVWSADVFARRNGLHIVNKAGIAEISSRLLLGKEITLAVEGVTGSEVENWRKFLPAGLQMVSYSMKAQKCNKNLNADLKISTDETVLASAVLGMKPKQYVMGIGCRRGTAYEQIQDFVEKQLNGLQTVRLTDLAAVSSIDCKEREDGIVAFSDRNRIPFYVFTKEELGAVEGKFHASEFVKKTVGVDNVCERAAAAAAKGELVLRKQAGDGITLALAKIPKEILYQRLLDGFAEPACGNEH